MSFTLKNSVKYWLISLLIYSMTLFARDKFNIKISIFAVFLVFNVFLFINMMRNIKQYTMIVFMVAVYMPVTVLVSSVMSSGKIMEAISAEYVNLYLLVVLYAIRYNIDIYKMVFNGLSVIVIAIMIISIADFLGVFDLYRNPLTSLILDFDEGFISKSPNAIFYYVVFLRTSPLLIFHLVYSLKNKRYVWTALSLVAIMFSGTRANVYLGFAAICVYLFYISKGKFKKLILVLLGLTLAVFLYDFIAGKISVINIAKQNGDLVRERTIPSIIGTMNNHPAYWIFGMGHGSQYYSYGRKGLVITSELSYFEMLRTVGIIGTVPFIAFMIYPIKRIAASEMKWVLIPYIAMLINSIVDPLLHTSTSYLMYIIIYYTYYSLRQTNQQSIGSKGVMLCVQ